MTRSLFISIVISLGCMVLFLGDSPNQAITMLYPSNADSVSYDQGNMVLVSALNEDVPQLLLSTQWEIEQVVPIASKPEKENFPKAFYKLFAPKTTIQSLVLTFKYFNGYAKPETLAFSYFDTVTVRSFWQKPEFAKTVKKIQTSDALEIHINVRGWQDSVYTPVYEDPNGEGRTLYKLPVQLIPGENKIYFASSEKKSSAVEYATTFVAEAKPTTDRASLFHNSVLEQSCQSCHEGLPSADGGASMNADCNVCHKEVVMASHLHSPVEMKECSSCHSWSVEKKAVVVETGVPEACYTCHDDKKEVVENSTVPHPVASECVTCHSPHGTDRDNLLKVDMYALCTSCHENQKINHPVGRHPVRFVKNTETGEEMSCITCHSPHGSNNQSLMKVPGDPSQVCGQCH